MIGCPASSVGETSGANKNGVLRNSPPAYLVLCHGIVCSRKVLIAEPLNHYCIFNFEQCLSRRSRGADYAKAR
jgi:hypothetical protein